MILPRRPLGLPLRICGFCAAGVFGIVLLVVALVAGLCLAGPVSVGGLGPQIAAVLDSRFGHGLKFHFGTAFLAANPSGLSLDIDGLTISSGETEKILYAPRAGVSIDFLALLQGKLVPKRLEVFDLEVRLVLQEDGSLAAAAGPGSKPFFELGHGASAPAQGPPSQGQGEVRAVLPDTPPAPAAVPPLPTTLDDTLIAQATPQRAVLMKEAGKAIRTMFDTITGPNGPVATIDKLGIKRGRLVIEDRTNRQEVVYRDFDLEFDRVPAGTVLALSAEGPSRRWSVLAKADGVPGGARHFQVSATDFSQDEYQLLSGTRDPGFESDVPVSMDFKIGLDPANMLSEADGRIEVGAGFFRLEDPDQEAMLIDKAATAFHWNGKTRQVLVDEMTYQAGTTHFALSGTVVPPLNEGEPWAIALGLQGPGVLGPDRRGEQPVVIDRGSFSGRVLPAAKRFDIDKLTFGSGHEGGLTLTGVFDLVQGPHLRFDASIEPASARIVKRCWPAFVAAPVRSWALTHFNSGTVQTGSVRVDYNAADLLRMRSDRAPSDASVTVDFSVSGASLSFLPGVPSVDDISGTGHLTGRHGLFTIASGTMDANGRRIEIGEGTFAVLNTDQHPTPAELTAHVTGSVEAISDVMARDAFKTYASVPLNPATLKGQTDGRLNYLFFLGDDIRPEDNKLRVNATITNFSADKLIGKEKLDNAVMSLAVDPGGLRATGQGKMFGGPASFELNRPADKPMEAVVNVSLDDAARGRLGLAATPGFSVTGITTSKISAILGGATDRIKAQVDADLTKATVTSAVIGLAKPAGKPAKVSLTLNGTPERLAADPAVIDIGSLQAHGAIEFGPENAFQSARFSSLKISPGDDMKIDVAKTEEGYKVAVRATTIDARPFLHDITQTPAESSVVSPKLAKAEHKDLEAAIKSIDIDVKAGLMTGFNKQVLSGVELRLNKRGPSIQQFSVDGKFGRAAVTGSMSANQRLHISSQDAGALVAFIDLYKHLESGQLIANMIVGDETLDGNLEINHFVLRDEPSMRQLVAQSVEEAPQGAAKVARNINANAVTFTKLKVDFQRAGSRLELKDATMYGSAIGISVDGWLDIAHDRVGMNGTFVPVFAVNNFFSQVPVLGFFLGGDSNEGLIAIKFRISGSATTPTLSVNPLSAITPGIFRKIFGALDPAAGAAQENVQGARLPQAQ